MGKKKVSKVETAKKEKLFFYEVQGIIVIIITILAITRLGLVGNYIMLVFRLLFGDWYFIFILLLFLYGIYCLLVHKKIVFNSIRYLGIVCICISLIILSHFSMHDYVINYDENYYSLTINLYGYYFKTNHPTMMVGGGIIGGSLFYLFYYLFSKAGTIILSVLLIFIGIVFICRKTIKEFVLMIINFFKKIYQKIKYMFNHFGSNIEAFNEDYYKTNNKKKKKLSKFILNRHNLPKLNEQYNEQCIITQDKIKECFNHLGIIYNEVSIMNCPHLDIYFIKVFYDINFDVLYKELKKVIEQKFLIRFNPDDNQIIIEVNKENPYMISFYQAIKEQDKYIFGMDDRNSYLLVDQNILIIGKNNPLMENYFISVLLYSRFCSNTKKDAVYLYDLYKQFTNIESYVDEYHDSYLAIGLLIEEIDQRIELLNNEHYANIDKYNLHHMNEPLNRKYIFIYGIEKILDHGKALEKLEYLLRLSVITGYYFIISLMENKEISTSVTSLFEYKVIFENYYQITNELINDNYFDILNNEVEAFLKWRDLLIRMCILGLSNDEIQRIKK